MVPRPTFPFPAHAPSYFLGHMARSLRDLPKVLSDIDLVIEARDARIPLSGVNGNFEAVIKRSWGGIGSGLASGAGAGWGGNTVLGSLKPAVPEGQGEGRIRERIVVYTKRDLGEARYEEPLRKAFLEHAGQKVFFADTNVDKDVKHILRYAVQLANEHSAVMNEMKILVVGMPNVGKSSLLNALRRVGVHKGKAFRISSQPGYTRKLTGTVRIHSDPDLYVYDTPGVMVPYMGKGERGAERALKFALTTGIKSGLFEEELVADYLLYLLNLHHYDNFPRGTVPAYHTALNLPSEPTESLGDLLESLARRLGTLKKGGEADTDAALIYFLKAFREGKLGRITLDELRLTSPAVAQDAVEGDESGEPAGEGSSILSSMIATMSSPSNASSTTSSTVVGASHNDPLPNAAPPESPLSGTYAPSSTTPDPFSVTSSSPASSPTAETSPPSRTRRNLDAEVSAAVRAFIMDQARKRNQTEEMSQSQERKKELQLKKKEKADKWKAKHPGLAGGVAGQAGGKGTGWSKGDMRMRAKRRS